MRYLLLFSISLFLFACNRPDYLEQALILAGDNRPELEKVLAEYRRNPADSLKYKAAVFLIENMPIHYYVRENSEWFDLMDSLNRGNLDNKKVHVVFDSLKNTVSVSQRKVFHDIKTLSSGFLMEHIDKSFDNWLNAPWKDNLSFDDFCEYILPYSVSAEKRESWTDYYRNKYLPRISKYLHDPDDSTALVKLCNLLNDSLLKSYPMCIYSEAISGYPPLQVDNIRSGLCGDYVVRTIFLMRSLGIPVASCYAPQWISYRLPHSWNILCCNGKQYPFMGFDDYNIGVWRIDPDYPLSKVYRETYGIQRNTPSVLYPNETIPSFLGRKNIMDVSSDYFPVSDVVVKIDKPKKISTGLAYLCVFNHTTWIPVHWGKITGENAKFTEMGRKIVYLPVFYTAKHEQVAAADPFILDKSGNIKHLSPNFEKRETLGLERKFHITRVTYWSRYMLNGRFQAANKADFSDSVDLYKIVADPKFTFNAVDLDGEPEYRYVRYIADTGHCNVAELEFYTKNNDEYSKLSGKIIGVEGFYKNAERTDAVFDGNNLTYFRAYCECGGWVGLDFGEKKKISRIRYLPRNDDNNVKIGNEYELFYWNRGQWNSLGKRIADTDVLIYNDCPSNALYLLHNHTRGIEERIFTYENGKQVWW